MQPATTPTEYRPPVGWADVATKQDVEALREWIQIRFDAQDARLAAQDAQQLAQLRADIRTGLADLRAELRTGLADRRAGVRGDLIGALLIMFGLTVALVVPLGTLH